MNNGSHIVHVCMTLLEPSFFSLAGTQSLEMPCRWKDLGDGKRKGGREETLLRIIRLQLQRELGKSTGIP